MALSLFSCFGGDTEPELLRVMLTVDSGATVDGEQVIEVEKGEDAVFNVSVLSTYAFVSVSEGEYDEESGRLTVKNVTERLNIIFKTEALGYDRNETASYYFTAGDSDTSTLANAATANLGTEVTVCARDTGSIFSGWSISAPQPAGRTVSEERSFTFRITPELLNENGELKIYANYKDSNVFYYDANGGSINAASKNITAASYYTAELDGDRVKVTLGEEYFLFASSTASLFYDDGSFSRDGHVLVEYNTKADGSGEGFSLGSKFYTASESDHAVLYCIWAPVSSISEFEYTSHTVARPSGINASNSENWNENGVIITSYNGDDERVVIPETIGGQPVIAIAKGAFSNKSMKELVLSKNLLTVADGAFVGCSKLERVYFSDGIWSIKNEAFDASSYTSLKQLYVNATIAPRFSNTGDGAFAVKLARLLSTQSQDRIIVIAGSSSYQGLASNYLSDLLDGNYEIINFGTTRTTHGTVYLEAMSKYAHEGDMVIYAPENSSYMLGESEMYWKSLRDLEGMNNFFRYIDISNYTNVFTAFTDFNQSYRYKKTPRAYEDICELERKNVVDRNGDYQNSAREDYVGNIYTDVYYITLNNRCKSKMDGAWNNFEEQERNKDYTDLTNVTWCSIDDERYVRLMNKSIAAAKSSGAKVYFGFAPVDASALVEEAKNLTWIRAYDELIDDIYDFDGRIGNAENYVLAHEYFYDCAFHTNDYGRTYRTYTLYCDIAAALGINDVYEYGEKQGEYIGCMFEENASSPIFEVDFLNGR